MNVFGQAASCGETVSPLTPPSNTNLYSDGSNMSSIATTLVNDSGLPDYEMALVNGNLLDGAGNPYLIGTSTDGTFNLSSLDMDPLTVGVQLPADGDQVCYSAIAYDIDAIASLAVTFSGLCPVIGPSLGIDAALCALVPNDASQVTGLQDVINLASVFGGGSLSLDSAVYFLQLIDSTLTQFGLPTLPAPCFAVSGFVGGPNNATDGWFNGSVDPVYCVNIVAPCGTVDAGAVTINNTTLCDQTGDFPTSASASSDGDSGGTWSISGDGSVTIDANTGAIDASGGTPGSYTVTYMVDGGQDGAGVDCPDDSATATLTVNNCAPCPMVDAGTVSVGNGTLCDQAAGDSPTTTTASSDGDAGGTWSIDGDGSVTISASGSIDANGGTAGSYTVTYTVDGGQDGAGADCPDVTATASVTVESCAVDPCLPVDAGTVTIDNTSLCIATGGANPTSASCSSNGTAGGTWSIDGDGTVTIDANTGAVNAMGGTAGSYIVTYTVDGGQDGAGADCPDVTATASLTVQDCSAGVNCNVNAGSFPASGGFEW